MAATDGPANGDGDTPWEERPDGSVVLRVHVRPGARRTGRAGLHGGALKVSVAAPAEGGRANAALVRYLAADLGIPRRSVTLVSGMTGRHKKLRIDGIDTNQLRTWVFGTAE